MKENVTYSQPSDEQVREMCNRLWTLPQDLVEQFHQALKRQPIEHAATLLWKAGASFTSAELYEYRKTLFPPNSLLDPYTSGPPALQHSADNPASTTDNGASRQSPPQPEPLTTDEGQRTNPDSLPPS